MEGPRFPHGGREGRGAYSAPPPSSTAPRWPAALPNRFLRVKRACPGLTVRETMSPRTCLAPLSLHPLRSLSSCPQREARGGTQGWDLRAQNFTRTPAHGGAGGGGQSTGWGSLGGAGEGRLGAHGDFRGGRALRPGPADPGWRPARHPPSHNLSPGAQTHTPS